MSKKADIEHDRLIIFGWIVTVLGMPEKLDPTKYNELTDRLYDVLEFRNREKQPLYAIMGDNVEIVPLTDKNTSDELTMALGDELEDIIGKHGVLTSDGWSQNIDGLVKDIMEWRKGEYTHD